MVVQCNLFICLGPTAPSPDSKFKFKTAQVPPGGLVSKMRPTLRSARFQSKTIKSHRGDFGDHQVPPGGTRPSDEFKATRPPMGAWPGQHSTTSTTAANKSDTQRHQRSGPSMMAAGTVTVCSMCSRMGAEGGGGRVSPPDRSSSKRKCILTSPTPHNPWRGEGVGWHAKTYTTVECSRHSRSAEWAILPPVDRINIWIARQVPPKPSSPNLKSPSPTGGTCVPETVPKLPCGRRAGRAR